MDSCQKQFEQRPLPSTDNGGAFNSVWCGNIIWMKACVEDQLCGVGRVAEVVPAGVLKARSSTTPLRITENKVTRQ